MAKKKKFNPKTHFEYKGTIFTKRPHIEDFVEEIKKAGILTPTTCTKVLKSFKREGLENFAAIENMTMADFGLIPNISEKVAKKLAEHKLVVASEGNPIQSFEDQIELTKNRRYLETRVIELNKNLNDGAGVGFRTGSLVEFFGKAQTGKTQWMYDLAVRVMLPKEKGGWGQSVLYLDTEGAYSVQRILKSGLYWGLTEEDFHKKMYYISPRVLRTGSDLLTHLNTLDDFILERDIGLIIVDSIIQPFKNEFKMVSGDGLKFMGKRQSLLGQVLFKLKTLAQSYEILACYTNQVIANIGGAMMGPKEVPVGGDTVSHASDLRFSLKKTKRAATGAVTRKMTLVDCGWLPPSVSEYCLTSYGIVDPGDIQAVMDFEKNVEDAINDKTKPLLNHMGQEIERSPFFSQANIPLVDFDFDDDETEVSV